MILSHTKVEEYLNGYSGARLIKKHSLSEVGVWQVCGEDPNCDMGGHHCNPTLGYYRGSLYDVITMAADLPDFYTWGTGGKITKIVIKDADADTQKRLSGLKAKREALEIAISDVNNEIDRI